MHARQIINVKKFLLLSGGLSFCVTLKIISDEDIKPNPKMQKRKFSL